MASGEVRSLGTTRQPLRISKKDWNLEKQKPMQSKETGEFDTEKNLRKRGKPLQREKFNLSNPLESS